VSTFGDYDNEMSRSCRLDDAVVEALVAGEPAAPDFERVAEFVEAVGHLAFGPAPVPSTALAVVLTEGLRRDQSVSSNEVVGLAPVASAVDGAETTYWRRRRTARVVAARVAGLSLVAKVALGISAAAASTAGAAAGVLPAPAQTLVSRAVESVTPFHLPNPTQTGTGTGESGNTDSPQPANSGDDAPTSATPPSPSVVEPAPPQAPASPVVPDPSPAVGVPVTSTPTSTEPVEAPPPEEPPTTTIPDDSEGGDQATPESPPQNEHDDQTPPPSPSRDAQSRAPSASVPPLKPLRSPHGARGTE